MKKKAFIPAIAMLVMVALALSTATYAWFTVRRTADVTVSQITATTGTNLEISTNGTTWAKSVSLALPFNNDKVSDISGNGLKFYKAKFTGSGTTPTSYTEVQTVSSDGNWVQFPLWFRAKDAMKIYLNSDSEVKPSSTAVTSTNKSPDGAFSKDYIAAATRVAFLDEGFNDANLIWAPNAGIELSGTSPNMGIIPSSTSVQPYEYVYGEAVGNVKPITLNPIGSTVNGTAKVNWKDQAGVAPSVETFIAGTIPETIKIEGDRTINSVGTIDTAGLTEDSYGMTKINVRIWVEGTDREAKEALAGGIFLTKLGFIGYDADKQPSPIVGDFNFDAAARTLRLDAAKSGDITKYEYAIYSSITNTTSAYLPLETNVAGSLTGGVFTIPATGAYTYYIRTKAAGGLVASTAIQFVFAKPVYQLEGATGTAAVDGKVVADDAANKIWIHTDETGKLEYNITSPTDTLWMSLTESIVFTGVQTVYVRRAADELYQASAVITLQFDKDIKVAPTAGPAAEGVIFFNTSSDMFEIHANDVGKLEYSLDGSTGWTDLTTLSSFNALRGSTIYIRYKETATHKASANLPYALPSI